MFGIVLAIVKMSACSRLPSAAASRIERTYPLIRETTVPAAITALLEMTDRSLVLPLMLGLSGAPALAGIQRTARTAIAAGERSPTPMPMITQMMLPTVLERMSISSNAPVGWPSSSVSTQPDRVDADRAGLGGEVHVWRVSASRSICPGASMTRSSRVCALMRTRTGWSRLVGDGHRERPLVGGEQHELGRLDAHLLQPGVEPVGGRVGRAPARRPGRHAACRTRCTAPPASPASPISSLRTRMLSSRAPAFWKRWVAARLASLSSRMTWRAG